jgi:hypothetical protein
MYARDPHAANRVEVEIGPMVMKLSRYIAVSELEGRI